MSLLFLHMKLYIMTGLFLFFLIPKGFPDGSVVKNLLAMPETQVQFLGQEDPLEKGVATHSSILAWRITWIEEPGRLQSIRSQRFRHDWVTFTFTTFIRESETEQDPMVLAPLPPCTMSSVCLLSVKNFSQKISLIREVRNAETQENSQRN